MMKDVIIKVRCPKCGFVQPTRSIKRVKCWQCGHVYKIVLFDSYGKIRKHRIGGIIQGTKEDVQNAITRELILPKRRNKVLEW